MPRRLQDKHRRVRLAQEELNRAGRSDGGTVRDIQRLTGIDDTPRVLSATRSVTSSSLGSSPPMVSARVKPFPVPRRSSTDRGLRARSARRAGRTSAVTWSRPDPNNTPWSRNCRPGARSSPDGPLTVTLGAG